MASDQREHAVTMHDIFWLILFCAFSIDGCVPRYRSATSTAYLQKMPNPDQVIHDFQGADRIDTAARQLAVFELLRGAIQTFSGRLDIRGMTPAETTKFQSYLAAEYQVGRSVPLDERCKGETCDRYRFVTSISNYKFNAYFQDDVAARYFPDPYRQQFIQSQSIRTSPEIEAAKLAKATRAMCRNHCLAAVGCTDAIGRVYSSGTFPGLDQAICDQNLSTCFEICMENAIQENH